LDGAGGSLRGAAAHQRRRSENLCERDWNTEDLLPRISDVNDRFPRRKITSLQKHPEKASVLLKVRSMKAYRKKNVKLKYKKMDGMICTIAFVTHKRTA
jgi:hypothetical protein